MVDRHEAPTAVWPLILAVVVALAVVALLAFARGEPGDDGRVPEAMHVIGGAPRADPGQ